MERNVTGNNYRLGILGGGQLGRMAIQEALNLGIDIHIMDPDPNAPCSKIASTFTCGDIQDFDAVYTFGKTMDTLTVEIENVSIEALYKLEAEGVHVFPQPRVLELIKDKGTQKEFYTNQNIPTAPYILWTADQGMETILPHIPCAQKLRTGGYDGKGVQIIRNEKDADNLFEAPCVVEELIDFEKELSVIVARNHMGEIASYPAVECEFNDANLVEFLFSPASITEEIEQAAQNLAIDVITKLDMVGILAVEMFLTKSGKILVNEIAPRPHNSGHHTIECNECSQFEQHLRTVLDLPLGSTKMVRSGAMLNVTGEAGFSGEAVYRNYNQLLSFGGVHLHLYGKTTTKPNRKMGHITVSGDTMDEVHEKVNQIRGLFKVVS